MKTNRLSTGAVAATTTDRRTLVAFVLMVVFAGGNAVAVRLSNFGLPPFWDAELRILGAALVFWGIVAARRIPLPRGRALLGALWYGVLSVGAAYAFMYWGLLRAPAGLGASILALVPLLTLFFAWAHGLERLLWQAVLGSLIATAGIVLGLAGGFGGAVPLLSLLALVAGTASFAEAAVVFKLFPPSHPVATNALALTAGAPLPLLLSLLTGEQRTLPATPTTWAAFAYLVLVGSVVVFTLYLYVLSRWTATATSYSFLLIPVATVVIAAWLLGEAVTVSFVIGAALVLAGVWVGVIRSSPKAVELTCTQLPSRAIC